MACRRAYTSSYWTCSYRSFSVERPSMTHYRNATQLPKTGNDHAIALVAVSWIIAYVLLPRSLHWNSSKMASSVAILVFEFVSYITSCKIYCGVNFLEVLTSVSTIGEMEKQRLWCFRNMIWEIKNCQGLQWRSSITCRRVMSIPSRTRRRKNFYSFRAMNSP